MFHCHFFFLTCSISKSISLCLGKMFKLVTHRPSFITSFENRRVKKDSEQLKIHDTRSTNSRWHLMMMKNDSAEVDKQRLRGTFTQIYFVRNFQLLFASVAVIGGSNEFLFKQYLLCNDTSAFADISIVFNFSFIFRLYYNLFFGGFHR